MHFDAYIDKFMQYVSVSEKARDILWRTTVAETSLSVPNSLRSWIRADLTGTSSRTFYDESLSELNSSEFLQRTFSVLLLLRNRLDLSMTFANLIVRHGSYSTNTQDSYQDRLTTRETRLSML
ncbi:hypothetical protein LB505_005883 [Fusarium chuoi]|nr:hypothetical protein LB505_005883 [Fusarium chuoi]